MTWIVIVWTLKAPPAISGPFVTPYSVGPLPTSDDCVSLADTINAGGTDWRAACVGTSTSTAKARRR